MTSYPHGSASSKNYFRHEEGQENVTYNQKQQQQQKSYRLKKTYAMELIPKDFKRAIINIWKI